MAKKLITSSVSENVLTLTVTVEEKVVGTVNVDMASLSDEIRTAAIIHGLTQKVSDAAAMPKDDLTGDAKKDAKAKLEAMQSVAERLASGEWSKRSGDGSGPVTGLIYRAFAEWVRNKFVAAKKDAPSDDAIRAKYDAMSRSDQLALRTDQEIAAIIERLKSERGPVKSVDTDSLLGELGL